MSAKNEAIVEECKRQAESCQYTSAALYEWLSAAELYNRLWNGLPIIFGAVASFGILTEAYPIIASFFALIAGLLPSVYEKLDLKARTDEILLQAGQYKNLEIRFSQAASISSLDDKSDTLATEFKSLMNKIEELRSKPLVIPEKHFQAGREKVKDGRYKSDLESS